MKLSIGLTTSVFMPIGTETSYAGNTNNNFYLGLIHVEIEFKNCSVEIVVNDIPVVRYTSMDESFQTKPIPEFLIAGNNKLEIIINPGPTPLNSRNKFEGKLKNDIFVATRIVQYRDGEWLDGNGGITLTNKTFNGKNQKSIFYPNIISTIFTLSDSVPKWTWQHSEKLELPRDQDNILKLLQELRDSFQSFNSEKIFELNKVSYEDDIRIYTKGIVLTLDQWKQELINDLESYKSEEKDNWKIKKINSSDFSLRLCANNRLIECIAKDWLPIIRSETELNSGGYFYFKMYVGKISGRWSIIRSSII